MANVIVEEEEKREIKKIYERKLALFDLRLILNSYERDDLIEKCEKDIELISELYTKWWEEIYKKYQIVGNGPFYIDFSTNVLTQISSVAV